MARVRRLLREDEPTVYHVISRTALDGLPFSDADKDYLLGLIDRWSKIFFVDLLGFAIMGNHFHLVVRVYPQDCVDDRQVVERHHLMNGKGGGETPLSDEGLKRLKAKLCSLSWYVKEIKQDFSRYFNKKHHRRGFLWGERFKSLIVEEGDTLINLLAYVDLNPVRAGIVKRPEEYRWCSMGYFCQTGNRGGLLKPEFGIVAGSDSDTADAFQRYRDYVYGICGIKEKREPGDRAKGSPMSHGKREHRTALRDLLLGRCRYFSDACVIGSRTFVEASAARFSGKLGLKRRRKGHRFVPRAPLYALRRLRVV